MSQVLGIGSSISELFDSELSQVAPSCAQSLQDCHISSVFKGCCVIRQVKDFHRWVQVVPTVTLPCVQKDVLAVTHSEINIYPSTI